jgi:flagella synthesis protein FlgN
MNTSAANSQEAAQVSAQLNAGITLFQTLKEILALERKHLEERDFTSFQAVTPKKASCLTDISRHEDEFNQLLESLHIELGDKTIDRLIEKYAPHQDTAFSEAAIQYRSLLGECDDLNTINGRIIQRSQVNANNLLDLIKGAVKQNQTYSRNGKTQTEGGKHPIAKA